MAYGCGGGGVDATVLGPRWIRPGVKVVSSFDCRLTFSDSFHAVQLMPIPRGRRPSRLRRGLWSIVPRKTRRRPNPRQLGFLCWNLGRQDEVGRKGRSKGGGGGLGATRIRGGACSVRGAGGDASRGSSAQGPGPPGPTEPCHSPTPPSGAWAGLLSPPPSDSHRRADDPWRRRPGGRALVPQDAHVELTNPLRMGAGPGYPHRRADRNSGTASSRAPLALHLIVQPAGHGRCHNCTHTHRHSDERKRENRFEWPRAAVARGR